MEAGGAGLFNAIALIIFLFILKIGEYVIISLISALIGFFSYRYTHRKYLSILVSLIPLFSLLYILSTSKPGGGIDYYVKTHLERYLQIAIVIITLILDFLFLSYPGSKNNKNKVTDDGK